MRRPMLEQHPLHQVTDLTQPLRSVIFNMSLEQARQRVADGDPDGIRAIDGQFALVGTRGHIVRLARTLGVPMRYFIAKLVDGPGLVVAHRIDDIQRWLHEHDLSDQFHPSYTRMVPAHYVTEVSLVGCPDPNPSYTRYFTPDPERMLADLDVIGREYVGAAADEVAKWLRCIPADEPVGVCFSGGIDSGAVLVITYHQMLRLGMNPARLKAFTLCAGGSGPDLEQARAFVEAIDMQMFLETIDVPLAAVDYRDTVRIVEDYKPLDVEAGAMTLALCRGIRQRYPGWTYLMDGDGGDENLKDYPIEDNPELTIRSVLNNPLLYHEGWGVDSIKHSLTYSGGLSRACTRTSAPLAALGFRGFSPYTVPNVVQVTERIPFVELTEWDHDRLYALKGQIVACGVKAVTGVTMPVHEKRRFQHGAIDAARFDDRFPTSPTVYRQTFNAVFNT